MLTEKHCKAVAEIIKRQSTVHESTDLILKTTVESVARVYATDLADYFATQNPQFDRDKFMKACGLGD